MPAKGQLQNLLSNMKWPAGGIDDDGEGEEEQELFPQQQPSKAPQLSLKTFPWLEFARLLGGWISGA